jgi:hypothetical protein
MRKLYKTDKKPAQIIVNKKMTKKQIKELREIIQNTPAPVIVLPEREPVKDVTDGG